MTAEAVAARQQNRVREDVAAYGAGEILLWKQHYHHLVVPIHKKFQEVGKKNTSSFGAQVLNDFADKNILEFAQRDLSAESLAAQKLPSHCS